MHLNYLGALVSKSTECFLFLELASLNHFSGCWSIAVVPSCLVPRPGWLGLVDSGWEWEIMEVVRSMGSGLVVFAFEK